MDEPNWDDLYIFERVAHYGSLSAASRQLEISQPTVSRHIQALEKRMRCSLFKRHVHGVGLTVEGERLLRMAQEMRQVFQSNWDEISNDEAPLAGIVRITASHLMAQMTLPPILTKIRKEAPEIEFVIIPSDAAESLAFRDVDIAIRLFETQQANVISKRIGYSEIACYGASAYFETKTKPRSLEDLFDHDMVGFDKRTEIIKGMAAYGFDANSDIFPLRSDHDALNWQFVKAGAGLGFMQRMIGDHEPMVERVLSKEKFPVMPVWLAASDTLRFVPRLRFVWDAMESELSAVLGKG